MTRIALRLALAGGRGSWTRLAITVIGVALGVVLLLVAVSFEPAVESRGFREAQRRVDPASEREHEDGAALDADATLAAVTEGWYGGRELTIVHLAAGGAGAPVPPGLPRLPAAGEVFVSPALDHLLARPQGELLRPRLPGEVVPASLGRQALVHPDELVAWVGWQPSALAGRSEVAVVEDFPLPPSDKEWWTSKPAVRVGVTLVAIGLLLPVVILVGVLTRLGAAQREHRLAVLRLLGATPAQTRAVAAMEAVLVALLGAVAGLGLFHLARPLVAQVSVGGAPWFPTDFAPSLGPMLAILLGVPLAAGAAAVFTLRRVTSSPLTSDSPQPPSRRSLRWPAALLGLGVAGLLVVLTRADELASGRFTAIAAVSLLAILLGLPSLGPWLVATVGSRLAQLASRAPTLLAARRSAADPRGAFRASSGVMLGVFVATIIYGYTTGNLGTLGVAWSEGDADVMIATDGAEGSAGVVAVVQALHQTDGVTDVLALRSASTAGNDFTAVVADCETVQAFQLARLAPCPDARLFLNDYLARHGVETGRRVVLRAGFAPHAEPSIEVALPPDPGTLREHIDDRCCLRRGAVLDPDALPDEFVAALPVRSILLHTDGAPATLERIRNVVVPRLPGAEVITPTTRAAKWDSPLIDARRIVTLAVTIALSVAAASLTAATVGRLLERRRPFTLLRATGVPLTTLFASVLIEAVVPLLLAVTLSAGLGVLTAAALVAALGGTFAPPFAAIALLAGGALLAGLTLVAATFPALAHATRPTTLRTA